MFKTICFHWFPTYVLPMSAVCRQSMEPTSVCSPSSNSSCCGPHPVRQRNDACCRNSVNGEYLLLKKCVYNGLQHRWCSPRCCCSDAIPHPYAESWSLSSDPNAPIETSGYLEGQAAAQKLQHQAVAIQQAAAAHEHAYAPNPQLLCSSELRAV